MFFITGIFYWGNSGLLDYTNSGLPSLYDRLKIKQSITTGELLRQAVDARVFSR